MTKKEIVGYVLNKLPNQEILGEDFQVFMESDYFDDSILDVIIFMIGKSLHDIDKEQDKQSLGKTLDVLKRIRAMEENSKDSNFDVESILDSID